MARFEGKTALVTGAAGGIGAAVVRMLRAEGARVAVADRDVSGIEADARLPGDLRDPSYADGLPAAAAQALGRLDIVVNNAGVITRGKVTETSDADWDLSVGVNVEAPFRISRAAIPIMAAAGGGAIVNTASCWGLRPGPNHAVYCMTKAALASLTQCMGMDHADKGIRINIISPGYTLTPMNLRPEVAEQRKIFERDTPIQRMATPDEMGGPAVFLLSKAASFVTGVDLLVDGGFECW